MVVPEDEEHEEEKETEVKEKDDLTVVAAVRISNLVLTLVNTSIRVSSFWAIPCGVLSVIFK